MGLSKLIVWLVLIAYLSGCGLFMAPDPPMCTLQKFESLQNGMTVEEANQVIGERGAEISAAQIGNSSELVTYEWYCESSAEVLEGSFRDGRLMSKGQTGLP